MRVLLMHASAGAGHRRAAEALEGAFRTACPQSEVKVSDILDFTPSLFRKTYADGYLDLVKKVPELWGYLYSEADRTAHVPWRQKVRTLFNKISTIKFRRFYSDFDPDIVVCTHFMPLQLLSSRATYLQNRKTGLFCAVTDFAVHALWILENVDAYYVATEEAGRHLIRRGQSQDRVRVTGIPIDPVFGQPLMQKDAIQSLGLPDDLPIVLLLSGGFGVGPTIELIRTFGREEPVCRLLVVAGSNEQMKKQAEELVATIRTPMTVYGFVSNMDVMMSACDLIVSKPGGLTSSEVLAKSKPMLIINPIPGQEQRNCEVLLENGAAARLFEIDDAYYKIKTLLENTTRMTQMSRNAEKLGHPNAANDIVADILSRGIPL